MLRFTLADSRLFAAATLDRNPIHLSPAYARETAFGQPLVHGVHSAIAALHFLDGRAWRSLRSLTADFPNPVLHGRDYGLEVGSRSTGAMAVRVTDGQRVSVRMQLEFEGRPGRIPAEPIPGRSIEGRYEPPSDGLGQLIRRLGLARESLPWVSALAWASFAVGMRAPGKDGLLAGIDMRCAAEPFEPPFTYALQPSGFDSRFSLSRSNFRLKANERELAAGELRAFVLPKVVEPDLATILDECPADGRLGNKASLVVGGTRGLGRALALALGAHGSRVAVTFSRSNLRARTLQRQWRQLGIEGMVSRVDAAGRYSQGQVADTIERLGRLDLLVLCASPALLPMRLDQASEGRFDKYVAESLKLAAKPLTAGLGHLQASQGWAIFISSTALDDPPEDWPHYVTAKLAVEAFLAACARQYPGINFLIVRAPKMATSFTRRPMGHDGASSTAHVAGRILHRLLGAPAAKPVEVYRP
jgi:NAD(P)-dependent dehydrogenase (short-subunit alcohol dehydrogenase family)